MKYSRFKVHYEEQGRKFVMLVDAPDSKEARSMVRNEFDRSPGFRIIYTREVAK